MLPVLLGASIFPTSAVTDFTGSVTTVIGDNIGVVLGIFAFVFGINWAMRHFNRATKGRI